MSNPNFNHPISREYVNALQLINHNENILSSNEDTDITQCIFNVKICKVPRGQGRVTKIINLANDVRTKRCITQIKSNDNLCCPRAIVTGLTYHTNSIFGPKRNIKDIRDGQKVQTVLAEELCQTLGEYKEEGFTKEDIKKPEELLDIQNKVVCAENFNTIIYSGEEKATKIYLYKNGNHFEAINNMKAILGSCYYCDKCDRPYNNKNRHRCRTARTDVRINCARRQHSKDEKTKLYCEKCNRYCFNQNCFDNHKDVCEEVDTCKDCSIIELRTEGHMCGYTRCRTCEQIDKTDEHKCYMQPKEL